VAIARSLFGRKRVTVHLGRFLLIISVVLGAATIFCFQTFVDFRESIKFGAALFVALLTIASILLAAENIRAGTQERRAASAAAFIARYNDPKFFEQLLNWRIVFRKIQSMKPPAVADYIDPHSATSSDEGLTVRGFKREAWPTLHCNTDLQSFRRNGHRHS